MSSFTVLYFHGCCAVCSFRAQQDAQRDKERMKNSLELRSNEKGQLERVRQALQDQLDALHDENRKLQQANSDVHRQRDQLEDEKEDLFKDKDRQLKEVERW